MRVRRITIFVLVVLIAGSWGGWRIYVSQRNRQLVSLLQHRQLSDARAMLNGYHDWEWVLQRIERSRDVAIAQAALDVQFENWYSRADDSNYSYSERVDVVRRLLATGAHPSFEHLVRATQQNKMQTARALLDAGVPAHLDGAADTPLANAAYWGDLDLMQQLLRCGADVNEPSAKVWRPILAAAWAYNADCVRYLLEHGADVSLPYEVWAGHVQPIWKVVEERASNGAESSNIWNIIWAKTPLAR
jgi:hypothetical protein